MSLINDALKRAKQAQQHAQSPGPSNLQFRPVEPNATPKRRWDWAIPAIVTIVGVTTLLLMRPWLLKDTSHEALETKARTLAATKQTSTPTTPVPAPAAASPEPAHDKLPIAPKEPGAATNSEAAVKPAAPSEPAAPQPPALRLQAIVYSPNRPSAIINGRSVFIGERVGDLRVIAITQETATLSGAGQTNVLTLIP